MANWFSGAKSAESTETKAFAVEKSDAEWKQALSPEQFRHAWGIA